MPVGVHKEESSQLTVLFVAMSASLIVATILVAGWNLTLTVTAFLTETGPFNSGDVTRRPMKETSKHVRADIGKPTLDARTNAWKRDSGSRAVDYMQSRVAETSMEVTRTAPYAEASVVVASEDGNQARRCAVCMN